VKTAIIALSAAALIAAAPAVFAHGPSSKSARVHHITSKKRYPGVSPYALRPEMQTTGMGRSYRGYGPGGGGGGTTSMEPNPNAGGGGGY
jgi:hypothetical protein